METLGDRIKRARELAGLDQTQLARKIGVKSQAISQWESGKTKALKAGNLLNAAKALGVSPDWLESGKGGMFDRHIIVTDEGQGTDEMSVSTSDRNKTVTLFHESSSAPYRHPRIDLRDAVSWVRGKSFGGEVPMEEASGTLGPRGFVIRFEDDTLRETIKPGSIVGIDPDIKPEPGNVVLALPETGDMPVLAIWRSISGRDYLDYEHPGHPREPCREILAKVVWVFDLRHL